MATSNIATVIIASDNSRVVTAKAHDLKTWSIGMPGNTTLATGLSSYANTAMSIRSSTGVVGSVGIGSTMPGTALDIGNGKVNANFFVGDGSQITGLVSQSASSNSPWVYDAQSNIAYTTGKVGINTASPNALLHIYDSATRLTNGSIFSVNNMTEQNINNILTSFTNDGNIGIGGTHLKNTAFLTVNNSNKNNSLMLKYPPSNYTQGNTIMIVSLGYGKGRYVISSSSSGALVGGNGYISSAFDGSSSTYWYSASSLYNNSTGNYTGAVTTNGYAGEYLQIQIPVGITLKQYNITSGSTISPPKTWKLFASINGSSWTELHSVVNATFTGTENKQYPLTTSYETPLYSYFRIVFNQITPAGVQTGVYVREIEFYGTEPINFLRFNDTFRISRSDIISASFTKTQIGFGTSPPIGNISYIYANGTVRPDAFYPTNSTEFSFTNNGITSILSGSKNNSTGTLRLGGYTSIYMNSGYTGMRIGPNNNTINGLYIDYQTCISANVGIGTLNPQVPLHVHGRSFFRNSVGIGSLNNTGGYSLQLQNNSAAKPSSSAWTVVSDSRLKEDVINANYDVCYGTVSNLDLKFYKWRDDIPDIANIEDRHKLGWIATDVQNIFPKAVRNIGDMYGLSNVLDLNVDQIYATMYGTIKKMMERTDIIESRLDAAGM